MNGKVGRENEIGTTGYREQNISIGNMEYVDYDRKSVIYNGNTIITTSYIKLNKIATTKYILYANKRCIMR